MDAGVDDHAMCDVRRARDNRERRMTRETWTMCYADDLRYDFNAMMNNTYCLTNNIKLLAQQTLQHGQEVDLGVGCDVLLDGFVRSAERSYLGIKSDGTRFLAW
jgi:hypothetical protein